MLWGGGHPQVAVLLLERRACRWAGAVAMEVRKSRGSGDVLKPASGGPGAQRQRTGNSGDSPGSDSGCWVGGDVEPEMGSRRDNGR